MTKKIKILHIQETVASGGVERIRLSLAKHLNKDQFEQKIICTHASGSIAEEIVANGVEIIPIGILKSPFHWTQHKKVQKIIEDYQPDIIHGAVFEGVTMAAINGWIKKVPIVILEETSCPINRSWKANLLMKFFVKLSDKIIGVSDATVNEYLIEKLKLTNEKVILINNGVPVPESVKEEEIIALKRKWGIDSSDFVVGSVGRMWEDSNKRFSDLIKAFSKFSIGKEGVKLLLVGDGRELENYKKLSKELGITEKVIFVGFQSDVNPFYKMMDVFSLVSTHEAFGLVLAEAMLNKLPVIATRVGGMKYIVDEFETGYLVEPKNVEEIFEKLEILFENKELKEKMGEAGFQRAMENYTESRYVQNIRNLYESLIERKLR